MNKKETLYDKLVKFDKKCNVFFAPLLNFIFRPSINFGNPNHTISTVFSLNRKCCRLCNWACKILHIIDKSHCEKSYTSDLNKIGNKDK